MGIVAGMIDEIFRVRVSPVAGARRSAYEYSLMKSAARSPIIMQVRLVLAWATVGMIEASPIQRFSMPWTRRCWSTTAMGSDIGPILQVPTP